MHTNALRVGRFCNARRYIQAPPNAALHSIKQGRRPQTAAKIPQPATLHGPARSRLVPVSATNNPSPTTRTMDQTSKHAAPSLASAPLVVVTIPGCPYCKKAKAMLQANNCQYLELDASVDARLRAAVREAAGSKTVPQVFIGGSSLGGADALEAALANGTFVHLVQYNTASSTPALPRSVLKVVKEVTAQRQQQQQHEQQSGPAAAAARAVGMSPEDLTTLASRAAGAADGVPRQPVTLRGRAVPTFSGQALLDWLQQQQQQSSSSSSQQVSTSAAPGQLAQALLLANLISPATSELPAPAPMAAGSSSGSAAAQQAAPQVQPPARYLFVSEAPASIPAGQGPLNTTYWWTGPARPAVQVAESLRGLILALYDTHLTGGGKAVNYKGLAADPRWAQYVAATAELQQVDITPLSREELCSLFINLYNALIIHATVVLGQPKTTLERTRFFSKDAAYMIGGLTYSADDMEQGVLRGNRAAASSLWVVLGFPKLAGPHLKQGDPRAAKVMSPPDPRIHFALVCGARSCPPINLYTPDNLEEGLEAAGEAFCAGEVEVDTNSRVIRLSKIFKWYAIDFGDTEKERLQYISHFVKGPTQAALLQLLSDGKPYKVQYKEYDWGLNE